ncbi:MAG: LuxR family transcriptional regulator [Reyranella sp.]
MSPFEQIDAFIRGLDSTTDLTRILALLEAEVQRLGFERFTYWLLWPPDGPRVPLYLSNYPQAWTAHYTQSDFKSHDIIVSHATQSFRPFLWADLRRDALTKSQRPVFDDAIAFGLRAGGNIPLHGPRNAKATLTVANDCPDSEFARLFMARRHELQLVAAYVHEKILQLGLDRAPPDRLKLSPRELDVLAWSAKGKTRWEIGEILGVAEVTVKKHLLGASRKLSATNKTQAIAVAIVHGLIIP